MHLTNEEISSRVEQEFNEGYKHIRIQKSEEIIKFSDIEPAWLPYLHPEVHLLSPYLSHERTLFYMFTEELISFLPQLKEEEIIQEDLLHIAETLLLGLDYLTHERFIQHPFENRHRTKLFEILSELFNKEKNHLFSEFSNRPTLNKSTLYQKDNCVYVKDERTDKTRIYAAILYKQPKNKMERFHQVATQLSQIHMKPNTINVPYEEILMGMTEHKLYSDTLFYLNLVLRTFSWFINSASWRDNEMFEFDRIDLCAKLSLK